jgi:hypothetical protein
MFDAYAKICFVRSNALCQFWSIFWFITKKGPN